MWDSESETWGVIPALYCWVIRGQGPSLTPSILRVLVSNESIHLRAMYLMEQSGKSGRAPSNMSYSNFPPNLLPRETWRSPPPPALVCVMEFNRPDQESANFICKGPHSKYLRLCEPRSLCATTPLCYCKAKAVTGKSIYMSGRGHEPIKLYL